MKTKKILFIHQNFPAQFKSIAPHLAHTTNYEIHTLSGTFRKSDEPEPSYLKSMGSITHHRYVIDKGSSSNTHLFAIEFETKMIRAEAVAKKCFELKEGGLSPDLIIDHPGWGESFFIKEIWPDCKLLSYFEFYYNTINSDIDFDLDEVDLPLTGFDLYARLRARNAPAMMSYLDADKLISPTNFQKNTAPAYLQDKINVIHDGIDTDIIKPFDDGRISIKNSLGVEISLSKKDKIVTFVNRNLEPYRGYHSFMRSLPGIQKKHPDAYILIIGGDSVSYGAKSPTGRSYKEIYLEEVQNSLVDISKVIFLGRVDYVNYLTVMGLSSVHVYLTYPFVLSWSMLEVMALETVIVGSKTCPVEEVIEDNVNGLLVDFFDFNEISSVVNKVLSDPEKYKNLEKNARKTIIDQYDLKTVSLPKQVKIIEGLLK
tara:strand:- start:13924 stop:15207 length:1284 start_codon:yes stop_codon:yes gene_type:complete